MVGMKKQYPSFLEESSQLFDEIAVSAGERGHQMLLPTNALANLINAQFVDIIV